MGWSGQVQVPRGNVVVEKGDWDDMTGEGAGLTPQGPD